MQDEKISQRHRSTIQERRNVMMNEHAMISEVERRRQVEKGMRESQIDERFRSTDMAAVHRNAMKKMQNKVKGV